VRMYNPFHDSQPALVSELPLKLARKCLDVFGAAAFDLTESAQSSSMSFFCSNLQSNKYSMHYVFIITNIIL